MQTDWVGGSGQTSWSDATKFDSSSSVTTSTAGQVTLTQTEELSNTGFETDLTSWNTGIQPDSISGLQLWLKVDAITGLNDGDSVTTWTDSSGNGADATQSTTDQKPLYKTNIQNGKPVVRFDGVNDLLKSTASSTTYSALSFFVVQNIKAGGYSFNIGELDNQSPAQILFFEQRNGPSGSSADRLDVGTGVTKDAIASLTGISTLNSWKIISVVANSDLNGTTVYGNGSAATMSLDAGGNNTFATKLSAGIGGLYNYNGAVVNQVDISEVIIYSSVLSTTNRSRIENYLRDKYAITISSGITSATRDTSITYSSSAGSAKLVTTSSDTGEFTQTVNVGDTNTYNLVSYARTDSSAVTSSDVELFYNGSTITTTYTSVGSGWYKLSGTVIGANASRVYGVQVKANKTVYVDNMSLNSYASSGTLTSSIFDTEQSSNWGTLTYNTDGVATTAVKARTSNSSSMAGATDFASCDAITSGTDISSNNCVTDTHRYIQYKISLTSVSANTPTFQDVSIAFTASDSTPPSISLTALSPDPNNDNTPSLSGTATDAAGTVNNVQFQMDFTSGSWSSCSADDGTFDEATETFTCTSSALSDGSHTMYVRATDSNSNTTASGSESSDTFTIDATAPTSIDLDSPGDNSYTNSERPSFKWKSTTDATAGLSKYVLEIDNPSIGSGQPSGDFTIDSIPTSRTTDYETNKYTIQYENFNDSDSTNNYISVYTKSHSDWGSSENDGKLREGRVSWKVKAVDNAGNEASSSRTLLVDRSNPKVELTQINDVPFSSTNFSTTDKTPTIFGKITDSLSGGDSSQTQYENGPKVASGPKQVDIKVEKKEGLGYKLITLYTINMDKPWYTCDGKEVSDNSKQKCDKYLPFEYTSKENLELGAYKITLTGKDKADNSSSEVSFTLNVTTLAQITTPEEKKIIEEETKELPKEEQEKLKEELEITKPTEAVKPTILEKTVDTLTELRNNLFTATAGLVKNVSGGIGKSVQLAFNGIGQGAKFVADSTSSAVKATGQALAFVGNKILRPAQDEAGKAIAFVGKTTGNTVAAMYNGTRSILASVGQGIGSGANAIGQGLAFAGEKAGQGISAVAKGTGDLLASIGQGIGNTGKTIGQGYNQLANNAPGVAKTILTGIGNGVGATTSTIANVVNTAASTTVTIAQNTSITIGNATHAIAIATSTAAKNTGNFIAGITNNVGKTTSSVAQNTTKTIGNIASAVTNTTSTVAHNTGSAIANATQNTVKATKSGIANIAFAIGEKTQGVAGDFSLALIRFAYNFVPEPTKITDVKVAMLSPTSVKVTWLTNHPANGKVNYGLDRTYPFDVQSEKRITHHEFTLTDLKPDTLYYFEVMSHNKNYVYDANREFKTPAK